MLEKSAGTFHIPRGSPFKFLINSKAVKKVGQSRDLLSLVRTDTAAGSQEHLKVTDSFVS